MMLVQQCVNEWIRKSLLERYPNVIILLSSVSIGNWAWADWLTQFLICPSLKTILNFIQCERLNLPSLESWSQWFKTRNPFWSLGPCLPSSATYCSILQFCPTDKRAFATRTEILVLRKNSVTFL